MNTTTHSCNHADRGPLYPPTKHNCELTLWGYSALYPLVPAFINYLDCNEFRYSLLFSCSCNDFRCHRKHNCELTMETNATASAGSSFHHLPRLQRIPTNSCSPAHVTTFVSTAHTIVS